MNEKADFVIGPAEADWAYLNRPLAVDPITFEIVRHKLEAINAEQGLALKEVSVSPIVAEAGDFNNALFTPDGRLASMGPQVVFHSGAMPIILRNIRADFPDDEIADGDQFIVNDPYRGAVHHPDVTLMAPIFHDGRLVGWTGVTAHQVDMGGMTVGSVSVRAKEKQQEGLMMPPMRLVERGKLRKDLWGLIMNMTRQPQMVGLDLRGFIASNVVARNRLRELIDRYGAECVLTVMDESIRYSERRMRERILALPDGQVRSRGFLDHDGTANRVYPTDVRIEKTGDRLRIDLSESSPQAPGYINCTEGCLVGAVFGGIGPLLGAGIPWNQGILNAIEVVAPKGLIVNANPPAATGAATIGQGWVISCTTAHALSKLLALSPAEKRHSQAVTHGTMAAFFTGDRNQHGEPFGNQLIDAQLGGGGATAVRDGIDQSGCFVSPKPHVANVEGNEVHGPMLFLYRAFFPDTGGDGEFTGGRAAGTAWTPHDVDRLRSSLTSHGVEVPISYGQFGGWPGVCSAAMIIHDSKVREAWAAGELPLVLKSVADPLDLERLGGEVQVLEAKQDELSLKPGDVVQYTWQGGGGYGDPLDREPAAVQRDVELGILSEARAAAIYGVHRGESPEQISGRRAGIREGRLARARPPVEVAASGEARGECLSEFGSGMRLARSARGTLQFECACGFVFCGASENWKLRAASVVLEGEHLKPGIRVHESLELVQYLCPACGRSHAIDVKEKAAGPLFDLLIRQFQTDEKEARDKPGLMRHRAHLQL